MTAFADYRPSVLSLCAAYPEDRLRLFCWSLVLIARWSSPS